MMETILDGTRRTLDFSAACGCRKLLFVSSGAVYGRQPADVALLDEEFPGGPDPTSPGSAYGEAKRAAELLCVLRGQRAGVEPKIARAFAFVGPYLPLDRHFAIGNFIGDALAGRPIVVRGDGTTVRSYMYGLDLALWLLAILVDGAPGRPYNVGSEEAISIGDLARRVAGNCGVGLTSRDPRYASARRSRRSVRPQHEPREDRAWAASDSAPRRRNRPYLAVAFRQYHREEDAMSQSDAPATPRLISVLTPCYNEEDNIEALYERVRAVFAKLDGYRYEHLFIDNASTDRTVSILREIAARDRNVKVIVNTTELRSCPVPVPRSASVPRGRGDRAGGRPAGSA